MSESVPKAVASKSGIKNPIPGILILSVTAAGRGIVADPTKSY